MFSIRPYENQNNSINIIPQDLVDTIATITGPLRKRDLEALGKTCKHFKNLTDNAPMWKNLFLKMREFGSTKASKPSFKAAFCSALKQKTTAALLAKVFFECDNHYAKMNISEAIEMVDLSISRRGLRDQILIKALLKKAELIAEQTPHLDENNETVCDLVEEILLKDAASPEEKAQAQYLKAKVDYLVSTKTAKEISDQLSHARLDLKTPHSSKNEAMILECLMAFEGMDSSFSKTEALDCLEDILHDRSASIEHRALAALYRGKELYGQKITEEDQEAAKLFDQVVNDIDVSEKTRMTAAFDLAVMCYEHWTNLITDEKAVDYLTQIKSNEEVEEELRGMTDLYRALFHYEDRIRLSSDDEAFQLLENVDENESVGEYVRYEATLYQAIMRYDGRTDKITDAEAMALLNEIITDAGILPLMLVSKASLYKALMLYRSKDDDKKAYELLKLVATNEDAEEKDRVKANEFLILMQDSGRRT